MPIDLTNQYMNVIYCNAIECIIGTSEVSLIFASEFPNGGGSTLSGVPTRIVLTHDQFAGMVFSLWPKLQFIYKIYGDKYPDNLNTVHAADPDRFAAAVREFFPNVGVQTGAGSVDPTPTADVTKNE